MPLSPNSATLANPATVVYTGGLSGMAMPQVELPDGRTIRGPHPEWVHHVLRWRWLLDSWEGGEPYRQAIYGWDTRGMPVRNMVRHKREYPAQGDASYGMTTGRPPGTDPAAQATDDDYELRRARTPVPTFVAECVEAHLSKIYGREIRRTVPENSATEKWLVDVDGRGTSIDLWMTDTIAPLLLVLGQLDLVIEMPPAPDGVEIRSRADETAYGLDMPRASYILPENMLWWRLESPGEYLECLVREVRDDGSTWYRYWSEESWTLYGQEGKQVGAPVPHPYGIVPIVRVFDRRRPRCRNIGLPRYEAVAELQREYYNRDSELILSDTTQAHPLLQGPEDYVQPDGTLPIGPNWLLPKKKNTSGSSVTYTGFEVVNFPKDAAESIRLNKRDIRDAVDRAACLTKPAGAAGTDGQTVSQSGISKQLDAAGGNDLLAKISGVLERCEDQVLALYAAVTGQALPADAGVHYPRQFDLETAPDLASLINRFQQIAQTAGTIPEVEGPMMKRLVRAGNPGTADDEFAAMDAGIDRVLAAGPPEPTDEYIGG